MNELCTTCGCELDKNAPNENRLRLANLEQTELLEKIRYNEKRKKKLMAILDGAYEIAEIRPELRYPEARKEANKAISEPVLRGQLLMAFGNRCNHCGSSSELTVDHIKPVLLGGSNDISNLQILCRSCNSRKGARFNPDTAEVSK